MTSSPLSPPVEREHIHTRRIECRGYHRADGLWDIEAQIHDSKSYAFENGWRGTVPPGDPVHDMYVRLTLDDRLVIHDAEAVTVASPFRICPEAAPGLARLKGLRIKPGWMREVRQRYGGREACTHIFELLRPLATTAFQTIFPYRERLRRNGAPGDEMARSAGPQVNSCYAYADDREVIRDYWPDRYKGEREPAAGGSAPGRPAAGQGGAEP